MWTKPNYCCVQSTLSDDPGFSKAARLSQSSPALCGPQILARTKASLARQVGVLFCFFVFFWIGELHFSNESWMSVGGDGWDLHSIFFSGFKSFLKIFNFHRNAAQNLGAACHLAVQPLDSEHSTKCMCSVWLRGLESHSGDLHRAQFLPLMTSGHLLLSALWPVLF